MKISLTQGKYSLVDKRDYAYLKKFSWHVWRNKDDPYIYAVRMVQKKYKKTTIKMHRVIMRAKDGQIVDHINHNTLDNRRKNLRIVTHSQNQYNRKTRRKYKGVDFRNSKYLARIRVRGRLIRIGLFLIEEDAARAYNKAAIKYFKQFALLNNINERENI